MDLQGFSSSTKSQGDWDLLERNSDLQLAWNFKGKKMQL